MNTQETTTESMEEQWQHRFLKAGTEMGLGDLSMMIGVVSSEITRAIQEDRARVRERISSMPLLRGDEELTRKHILDWGFLTILK